MSNGVHEANELTLVGSQFGMALGNGAAEESYSTVTLVQHCPKPCNSCVTVDDEFPAEVRHV